MADLISKTTTSTPNAASTHIAGAGMYRIQNDTVNINLFDASINFQYPKAYPIGSINIVQDFPWCNSTNDKSEVPFIFAEEYELTWGQTVTNFQRIYDGLNQIASGTLNDPYMTMYTGKPTNFRYFFPQLLTTGSELRSVQNSWGEKDDFNAIKDIGKGFGLEKILGKAESITSLGMNVLGGITTGFGYEEIQKFGSTTANTLTVSFPLYNTIDTRSAFKNYCFCLLFAFQNLKTRTSFMTYIPPKLYTLSNIVNGGTYMPVAIVDKFVVESIGTTRTLSDHWKDGFTNTPIVIPEAYKVTITFRELIPQSANIMLGSMGGSKISVIGDKTAGAIAKANEVFNWAKNATGEASSAIAEPLAYALTDPGARKYIPPDTFSSKKLDINTQ